MHGCREDRCAPLRSRRWGFRPAPVPGLDRTTAPTAATPRSSMLWRGASFCGRLIGVFERNSPGKIEAADQDAFLGIVLFECVDRSDAEAARDDAVRANRSAEGSKSLLRELIHRALVLASCGEQPLLALEDDREVGGKGVARLAFGGLADAEHHPQAPPIRAQRPGKADPDPTAIGASTAIALELGVVKVHIEAQSAADPRAQITVAAGEAAVRRLCGGCAGGSGDRTWDRRYADRRGHQEDRMHPRSLA